MNLKDAYKAPSIYDVAIRALVKSRIRRLIQRYWIEIFQSRIKGIQPSQMHGLKCTEMWMIIGICISLLKNLVDIEDSHQQWRFRHMKTVERIIGFKTGTGGSSGVNYLKSVLDHRFFPELWDVRTKL